MEGVLPALAAAVGFAVFQLVQRRALGGVDLYVATASVLAVAATVLGGVALATTGFAPLAGAPLVAVLACAAAGFVHFGLGWTFLAASQVRLGAARAGIVIGSVPLFGALLAALVLDEPLGPIALVGLVLVVAGVVVIAARRTTGAPQDRRDARVGLVAGLVTALCWSVSPLLIRRGLQDIESPLLAAGIGMTACALVYGSVVLGTVLRSRARLRTAPGSGRLLLVSGTAVGLAILLQWTAYDRAPVAVVLALLQLTPPIVVGLAARISGDPLDARGRRRTWVGTGLTVAGSLALVLTT